MNPLFDTVFYSEKRRSVMLLLLESPRDLNFLKKELHETSVSLLPQIKRLIDDGIVIHDQASGEYRLTMIGDLIAKKIRPFIRKIEVIDRNPEFWAAYDLSAVPGPLLDRLSEIGRFSITEIDLRSVYFTVDTEFCRMIAEADNVKTFTTFNLAEYIPVYYERLTAGIPMTIMITSTLIERGRPYFDRINELLKMPDVCLYESPSDIKICELTVTDKVLLLSFYPAKDDLNLRYLVSYEESAIRWGNDLFDYLKSLSVRKTELRRTFTMSCVYVVRCLCCPVFTMSDARDPASVMIPVSISLYRIIHFQSFIIHFQVLSLLQDLISSAFFHAFHRSFSLFSGRRSYEIRQYQKCRK